MLWQAVMAKSYTLAVAISLTNEKLILEVKEHHKVEDVVHAIKKYYHDQDIDLDALAFQKLGTKKFNLLFSRKGKIESQIEESDLNEPDLEIITNMENLPVVSKAIALE